MLKVLINGKDSGLIVPDTQKERAYWQNRQQARIELKIKLIKA